MLLNAKHGIIIEKEEKKVGERKLKKMNKRTIERDVIKVFVVDLDACVFFF